MRKLFAATLMVVVASITAVQWAYGANHREAPITALDHKADITDVYAFVSYDDPSKATFILNVDPLLEPANGPNYFPFDPDILYAIKVDNNRDAVEDITFEFRFRTEIRKHFLFTGHAGVGTGLFAPSNSPAPVPPGTQVLPSAITALDGPGSEGLSLRQSYRVGLKTGSNPDAIPADLTGGKTLYAVPTNVGPRTMPEYSALSNQGIYALPNGIKVFAGTVDDPFWIDLGAAFDTLNFRNLPGGSGVPGVLTPSQDANDETNYAADAVSGFNVNSLAIEVPIAMLTRDGQQHNANEPEAVIGVWATTSRQRLTVRRSPNPAQGAGEWRQVQRMGNPLINEVLIGTGFKDKYSMSHPKDDGLFAAFVIDPVLPRVLNALYGGSLSVPNPPRNDLASLVVYVPPVTPDTAEPGPIADLLRLNTGVPPTPGEFRSRLGLLGGDAAGWPNGRRVSDDVTDIALRAVAGVLAGPEFDRFPNNVLGDGVNTNDLPYRESFPYVAVAHSGRNSRHVDPGEPGGGPEN